MVLISLVALAIMFVVPHFTTMIPSALVAIGAAMLLDFVGRLHTLTVGDRSSLGIYPPSPFLLF